VPKNPRRFDVTVEVACEGLLDKIRIKDRAQLSLYNGIFLGISAST